MDQNTPLADRLELAQMDEAMQSLTQKRVEKLTLVEEEPVLLLMLSSGLPIYSRHFQGHTTINESLLGGFLSAINLFSKEAFATTGSIERIKHQDFTLAMKYLDPIMICYAFKGSSYLALKKLDQIFDTLHSNEVIWGFLLRSNIALNPDETKIIEQALQEIIPIDPENST